MNTQMIVRIDPESKSKVSRLAKSEGKNISQLVRDLLEGYVKDRDIETYIDGLWDRIATKLKNRGAGPNYIPRIIDEVRACRSRR